MKWTINKINIKIKTKLKMIIKKKSNKFNRKVLN